MIKTVKRLGSMAFAAGLIAAVILALSVATAFAAPAKGTPETWYKDAAGNWFYYNGDGNLESNLVQVGNDWYFFDTKTGAMLTGWITSTAIPGLDGREAWMYFIPGKGKAATDWYKVGKSWYLFSSEGEMYTGWQKRSGKWYYLKPSGAMAVGWQKVNGSWYYFNSSGAMQVGWQKINGTWYYFMSSGKMVTGEQSIGGKWYNFESSGAMFTGWLKVLETVGDDSYYIWHYYKPSGDMAIGWYKVGKTWYYFEKQSDGKGVMVSDGLKLINGANYYFEKSGAMAANQWKKLTTSKLQPYYEDENGDPLVKELWYYFGSNGKMMFGEQDINGKTYYLDEEYGYLHE